MWLRQFIESYGDWFVAITLVIFLVAHFFSDERSILQLVLPGALAFFSIPVLVAIAWTEEAMSFYAMIKFLVGYAVCLYIVLCDLLLMGGANYLTRIRGEKWAKEIDYVYLLLGTIGVVGTINRIDIITGRMSNLDVVGPLVLITAIVVRLIKTRVEIGEWNKPGFNGPRVVPFDDLFKGE